MGKFKNRAGKSMSIMSVSKKEHTVFILEECNMEPQLSEVYEIDGTFQYDVDLVVPCKGGDKSLFDGGIKIDDNLNFDLRPELRTLTVPDGFRYNDNCEDEDYEYIYIIPKDKIKEEMDKSELYEYGYLWVVYCGVFSKYKENL